MDENQKNKEKKQEVSETKNNPQEGSPFPKDDEIEDRESYSASFPPGSKFNPTDEDLIIHYLKPKNLGQRLPPNKIVDINLYEHSPKQLYETYNLGEKMVYFFTPRDQKYRRGTLLSRSAADGFWKSSGGYVLIGNPENPTGYKNSLVFYKGKSRESTKTNWVMQEYTTQKSTPSTSRAPRNMTMDVWVLCRLYNNSAKEKEKTNPGQSDLESPLSAGTLPPGLDHVNSQRPAHTGESSFPKPQLYQSPLVSVKPQPPGLHNFNHSISAHTGGYHVPMPCSNQDLLSTRPPPSEMSNIHSWMPGNSGQTPLHKPDQPRFQNVNSQMAAHNTGESCCHIVNQPLRNIVPHGELPISVVKPQSNQDLSLLNGYNSNDFTISKCDGQINGYDCGDHKYSQDLSTGLVHDLATETLFMDDWMHDFSGVPADMTEFEVPLPDYDFSSSDGFFDYPELHDTVPDDKAEQVP